jgi:catechol 2,3-dioxygenase-like lactoylglutathione lyase family enzyme
MTDATTSSMAANITASDFPRSIKFYTEGLGFEIVHKHEVDGVLRYAAMKRGTAEIGVGTDDFAKGRDRVKGVGLRLFITTSQDINALAAQVKKAGITIDEGPAPLAWGPMGLSVTDPDGIKLTIANPRT